MFKSEIFPAAVKIAVLLFFVLRQVTNKNYKYFSVDEGNHGTDISIWGKN